MNYRHIHSNRFYFCSKTLGKKMEKNFPQRFHRFQGQVFQRFWRYLYRVTRQGYRFQGRWDSDQFRHPYFKVWKPDLLLSCKQQLVFKTNPKAGFFLSVFCLRFWCFFLKRIKPIKRFQGWRFWNQGHGVQLKIRFWQHAVPNCVLLHISTFPFLNVHHVVWVFCE